MADQTTSIAIVTTNNLNNSNKARREEDERALPAVKTERKAVTGRVKKESLGSKFKRAFFGENVENVGEYMLFDVAIPAFKATISDMIGNGIEVLLFGESRGRRGRGGNNYSSYASLSRSDRDRGRDSSYSRNSRRSITYSDISFDTKSDCKEFLSEILDYVKEYERISVAVYCSILNQYTEEKIATSWRDDRVGWYLDDFRDINSMIIRTRDGWEIDIPNPGKI